ncbi:serine hydrolase [Streptomyces sp. NPDC002667]|uniref:serine hydrolase n=1 Tax=Streptomyces sp. NPDC002667 TaxID=3364657 RepID=UPI0036A004CF
METIDGSSGGILVMCGGATVMQASADVADVADVADAETGTPCTSGTRFQIASVSAQFTALAVMRRTLEPLLDSCGERATAQQWRRAVTRRDRGPRRAVVVLLDPE